MDKVHRGTNTNPDIDEAREFVEKQAPNWIPSPYSNPNIWEKPIIIAWRPCGETTKVYGYVDVLNNNDREFQRVLFVVTVGMDRASRLAKTLSIKYSIMKNTYLV